MSYSKFFNNGFRNRNQDHFAAIVRIAMVGGKVNNNEKAFLDPFAQKLEISKKIYSKILNDYNMRHINPLAELKKAQTLVWLSQNSLCGRHQR